MSNRAWVTLATNDSYGLGALVLAHSLRRVSSAYPAVVLITPSVTDPMRDRLRAVFAEVIIVDVLDSGDAAHLALLQRPELGITFTKIHCWNLTQYEKCVFLDADTLIVQNCDELFEREQLSAAPDVGWPDCFNSGVFVYTPSADTFSQLIAFAQERGSFDGGDQGLLNSFFSDWARGDINKHLPFLYNVTSAAFYSYLPALKHYAQDLKIIHFIGAAKPWLQQFNFESGTIDAPEHIRGLLQLWWDLFVSQVHCQLDTGMVEVEESPEVPAISPQDVSQEYYYQPLLDPESEFSWHHPHAQNIEEAHEKQIDVTEFFDPWDIYKGHIPAKTGNKTNPNPELTRIDNQEEVRNYAWNYQAQEHNQPHDQQTQHSNFIWKQQHRTQNHHWQDSSQQHDNPSQPTDHHYRQYSTQHDNQTYNSDSNWPRHSQQHENWLSNWQQHMQQQNNQTDRHWQHDIKQTHNTENNWQNFPSNNTETLQYSTEQQYTQQHNNHTHNYDHIWQNNQQQKDLVHHINEPWTNYHQQHENESFKTNNDWQPIVQQNHNQTDNHWQQQQGNHNSNHDWVCQNDPQHHNNETHGSHNLEYISQRPHNDRWDDNENYHSHDHHTHLQNHRGEHQNNTSSPTCQFNTNDLINDQHHCEEPEHIHKKHTIHENITVHHVQVENSKKRNRHKRKLHPIDDPNVLRLNGDVSDNESNCSEEVIPRHPYDGFYLRHRVTIDSRGRKICSHEIPPTPPVSPPPESLENGFNDNDEDEYSSTNNFEAQSGVAGNFARVLPGAAGQREALDELTRRQGWEAGNIDYMGADSFDNIWAKISQTLSKPRISPPKQSPSKEVTPAQSAPEQIEVQCGEVTKEPVSEQVEVAKEATPMTSAAPIKLIAPVKSAVVLATETESVPAPPQVTSAIEASTQATIPAKPAIPVAEIVAQIETAPLEVSASLESTDAAKGVVPVETTKCPAKTEIPVESVPPTEISAVSETVEAVTPVETTPTEISATSTAPAAVELVAPVAAAPIAVPEAIKAPAATDAVAPENAKPIEIPANIEVPTSVEAVTPTAPIEAAVPIETLVALETVAPAGKVDIPTAPAVSPPSGIPVTLESTELEVPTIVKEMAAEKPVVSENVKKIDDQVPTPEPVKIIEQPEQKTENTAEKKGKSVPLIASEPAAEKPSEITATLQSTDKSPVAAAALETTPEKPTLEADTDSPPLVNTPSKEEELDVSAVKSEERRKPAGKLKLVPPAAADPLPTPDSELEDAATLAQSIIASELRTPTVTSPESAVSPASPPLAPTLTQSLSVKKTEVPTPPVGTVSLAQIGVKSMPKGKSTTAAQIESSVETPLSEATSKAPTPSPTVESTTTQAPAAEASTPTPAPVLFAETPTPVAAPSEAPKKKIVKKVVKKEAGATGADAPVPPPRKKEKKPKEK